MTVAEQRQRAITNYCIKHALSDDDYLELKSVMNSYYRLCARFDHLLEWDNNDHYTNKKWVKDYETKAMNLYVKLQKRFNAFGLELVFFGYLPTICYKGTTSTAIEKYFYERG